MESLFFFIWTGMFVHATATRAAFARIFLTAYPLDAEDGASYYPNNTYQYYNADYNFLFVHVPKTFFNNEWFKS